MQGIRTVFITTLVAVFAARATVLYTDVSSDSLTVGDRIAFTVSLVVPRDAQVQPPDPESNFGEFVVRDWSVNRQERSQSDSLAYTYVLAVYNTGNCSIPALPFIEQRDTTADTLLTAPIPMRVVSVITADSATLRDIKAPLVAGKPSYWWLWALLAAGALTGIVLTALRFRKRSREIAAAPPPKPPYEEALAALAALEAKKYVARGLIREYAYELSEIFKRYLGRRYNTHAAELTTEEMLDWIKKIGLPEDIRSSMRWFFETSHMVKFARWSPDAETIGRFGAEVRAVLDKTRPAPDTEQADDKEVAGA